MDFNELVENYMRKKREQNMSFNDLFKSYNAKDLRTRVNYIQRKNPRFLNGVAIEDVFQKMFQEDGDRKIFWFVRLRNLNILYIETYENELGRRGEERWYKAWDFCDKVVFILLNPYTGSVRVREYVDEGKIIEYHSLDSYIYEQYKVDCSKHIQELFESINSKEITTNSELENYVNYIEREEKDTLLYRMDSLIFGDLWAKLKKEESEFKQIFHMNFDMVLSPNHIIECKGKTLLSDNHIIMNKWEFSILSMLVHQKKRVTWQVMLSNNEEITKMALLKGEGISSNVSIMYLELTKDVLKLFIENVDSDGAKTMEIHKRYFTTYSHPYIDELERIHLQYVPYINWGSTNYFKDIENQIKDHIVTCMKTNYIANKENIWFENDGKLLIGHIGTKKILCKFVEQIAWRIAMSEIELDEWKEKGIDYIFVYIFYKQGNEKNVEIEYINHSYKFVGYITIDDFKEYATMVANTKLNRGNNYRRWLKLKLENQIDDVSKYGKLYSYSIVPDDVQTDPLHMRPFRKMTQITINSYNDFN